MRENDRGDVVAVLVEETEIGDAHVHAERGLGGEAHPGVEDDHLVAVAHRHAVHPELADPAKRDNLDCLTHFSFLLPDTRLTMLFG